MINKKNLLLLADYLRNVVAVSRRQHFNMRFYLRGNGQEFNPSEFVKVANRCGTVACAVGHAPAVIPAQKYESYNEYCLRVFGMSFGQAEWIWCFSGKWAPIDNTPEGAAARIEILVQDGLPKNWSSQLAGTAPLCYT